MSTYSESQVDTAICIFAWIDEVTILNQPSFREDWDRLRGNIGTAELRTLSIKLIPFADSAWEYAQSFFPKVDWLSFDFEFVPLLFSTLSPNDLYNGRLPDIPTRVAEMVEYHKRLDWYALAKSWSDYHWSYDGLIKDHPERFEAAFQNNESPIDAVIEIGKHYDLSNIEPYLGKKPTQKWEPEKYKL